jgi:hypothetical protein
MPEKSHIVSSEETTINDCSWFSSSKTKVAEEQTPTLANTTKGYTKNGDDGNVKTNKVSKRTTAEKGDPNHNSNHRYFIVDPSTLSTRDKHQPYHRSETQVKTKPSPLT